MLSSQNIVYNWNEFVAKKRKVFVLKKISRVTFNLRLRQKMKWSQYFFEKKGMNLPLIRKMKFSRKSFLKLE